MKSTKIIWIHIFVFLGVSILFFFLSEEIIKLIFTEIHNVVLWLRLLLIGLILIFICSVISCIYFIRKNQKLITKN